MRSIVQISFLLVVVFILASASMTLAKGMQHGQREMGMMPGLKANPLTPAQQKQIAQIRQETQQKVRDIRMNKNLSQQDKQKQIAEARTQGHQKVMNVLTPAQKTEFDSWSAQKQGRAAGAGRGKPAGAGMGPGMGRGMGPGMRGPGQMMNIIPGLQQHPLSQEQNDQISGIRTNAQQQMNNITNDTSLTQDQKMQKTQQVQRETHDAIVSVLTPEQQQELGNWWQSRQQTGPGQQNKGMMPSQGMPGNQ